MKLGFSVILLVLTTLACTKPSDVKIAQNGNGLYIISTGNKSMSIDANVGARITSFKIDAIEILSSSTIQEDNYGSTFWPSPQQSWKTKYTIWPPPDILDKQPYEVEVKEKSIIFTSIIDTLHTGLQFKKRFLIDVDGHFSVTYTIINHADSNRSVAPWEVTRVSKKGNAFFPFESFYNNQPNFDHNTPTKISHGIYWCAPTDSIGAINKIFIEGKEGWLAYSNDSILFVKQFKDISASEIPPGEGEIQVYLTPELDMMELENHGPYTVLKSGDSLEYEVKWQLMRLPKTSLSQDSLVQLARGLAIRK